MSATKARVVLDLIRGKDVDRAADILRDTPREAADVIGKLLASAVANAVHNDGMDPEELYVSACYADEGVTLKRWRPRARGRATRIRKRSCHITVIVSEMPEDRLARRRAQRQAAGAQRQRRVAESRRRADLAGRLSRRRHAAEEEAALAAEAEARAAAAESEEAADAPEADAPEAGAPEVDAPEVEEATFEAAGSGTDEEAADTDDVADDGTLRESEKGE